VASTRPRTYAEAREVSTTNFELAWWVFMRVSGLILVFLVFGHLWTNNIVVDPATIDYAYVANRLAQPGVRIYDTFLLFFAMLHGVNGLRYSIEDYTKRASRRFWFKVVLYTVSAVIFVFGTMTLWAFTYQEMGDAVRAIGMTP
jgi:succinate dehydrogenase / fumarate reductase, membrane anchor subunit